MLEAVAKAEEIEVGDADLDAKINEIASSRAQAPEAIRGYLEKEGAMGVLATRIAEEKTLEWLFENAELVDAPAPEAKADDKPRPRPGQGQGRLEDQGQAQEQAEGQGGAQGGGGTRCR